MLALEANMECPGGSDSECPEGAICRTIGSGALSNRCTYLCGSGDDCLDATTRPVQSTCGNGGTSSESYCGG